MVSQESRNSAFFFHLTPFFATCGIMPLLMGPDSKRNPIDIIVLGRRLGPGGQISGIYRRRLDRALEIYQEKLERGVATRIVITGGDLGRRGISEARAGREYLCGRADLPEEDVVLEEKAHDTMSNAVYSKMLLLRSGCRTPVVVTSCYHIPRTSYIFSHILGKEFEPTYVSAPTGLDGAEFHRHWHSKSEKMIQAVEFLDRLDAPPGDHQSVVAFLREKGLIVEDTVP